MPATKTFYVVGLEITVDIHKTEGVVGYEVKQVQDPMTREQFTMSNFHPILGRYLNERVMAYVKEKQDGVQAVD